MIEVDQYKHPGLYRYSIELLEYPELTDEQYTAIMTDLKRPEGDPVREAAREKLIQAHLGMVLGMAVNSSFQYYGLSMEDFVGIGNLALVEKSSYFKPGRNARYATYMKKVIERWVYGRLKSHVTWDRDDDIGVEAVGIDFSKKLNDECVRKIHEAISTLTREERTIVELMYLSHGKPKLEAVAERLHRTPDGLKRSLAKIYDKLRPKLWEVRFPRRRVYITSEGYDEDIDN